MGALDEAGVYFNSPAEAEADLNSRTYQNSVEEKLYREERLKGIEKQAAMVRDGAVQLMQAVEEDAGEYDEAAQMYLVAVRDLRKRIKNRDIPSKEARTEIAKLNKEAERLAILADTLPNDYAKALHDRDHPRAVLDLLYQRYPLGPMRFDF
jgi:hypothetical protein